MVRILLGIGSVLLEIATALSQGALAVSLLVAGIILAVMHLTIDSSLFHKAVNRLTGFDLPESINPIPSRTSDENDLFPPPLP